MHTTPWAPAPLPPHKRTGYRQNASKMEWSPDSYIRVPNRSGWFRANRWQWETAKRRGYPRAFIRAGER